MRRKQWVVTKSDISFAQKIADEVNIDPLAALIVTSRGLKTAQEISDFFDEDAKLTLDPLSIKDMDKAAKRINKAIDEFETICIYGDYDCDGVTSTALLFSFLESMGANVIRYIPDRIKEGYGLNNEAIDKLKDLGVRLIVTVDTGATAVEEVKYAYGKGIEVVITDHHQVGDVLPECEAVVDPHRPDCPSTFKEMSGVGVAFKLACAVNGGDDDALLDEYGELVALGTIGDVVSLTGENRIMVKRGLKNINEHPGIGITALIEAAGVGNKEFTSSVASYTICPRINAAGRMGSADKALDLLLCDYPDVASDLAVQINTMNAERQRTENEMYRSALAEIQQNQQLSNDRIIVVDGDGWHQGVIGIVAAKLTERFERPAIVISNGDGESKGSCRSIPGFSIYDAIEAVSDTLNHFGGHTLAAGIGLDRNNIENFRKRINEYAADKDMPFAKQRVDLKLQLNSINLNLLSSISALEPFGTDNPQPLFGLFGVKIEEINGMGEGNKHTRLVISKNSSRISALLFGVPDAKFPFEKGENVDLAVNLERNVFNGETRVSVIVRGVRPSSTDEEKVLAAIDTYNRLARDEKLSREQVSALIPERDIQVDVFKSVKNKPLKSAYGEELCVRLGDSGENLAKYLTAIDIMLEMGLFSLDDNECLKVPENTQKVNIEDSKIMKKLRALQV